MLPTCAARRGESTPARAIVHRPRPDTCGPDDHRSRRPAPQGIGWGTAPLRPGTLLGNDGGRRHERPGATKHGGGQQRRATSRRSEPHRAEHLRPHQDGGGEQAERGERGGFVDKCADHGNLRNKSRTQPCSFFVPPSTAFASGSCLSLNLWGAVAGNASGARALHIFEWCYQPKHAT